MTNIFFFAALLWPAIGLLALLPHIDGHRCMPCLAVSAVVCAVLGPLVWVIAILGAVGMKILERSAP